MNSFLRKLILFYSFCGLSLSLFAQSPQKIARESVKLILQYGANTDAAKTTISFLKRQGASAAVLGPLVTILQDRNQPLPDRGAAQWGLLKTLSDIGGYLRQVRRDKAEVDPQLLAQVEKALNALADYYPAKNDDARLSLRSNGVTNPDMLDVIRLFPKFALLFKTHLQTEFDIAYAKSKKETADKEGLARLKVLQSITERFKPKVEIREQFAAEDSISNTKKSVTATPTSTPGHALTP